MKKRLIVDMDDVMADTSSAILNIYNAHFKTNHFKSDLFGSAIWDEEIKIKYLEIRHKLMEPGFFADLKIMPDAQKILKDLQSKYEIFVVSAAMEFPNSLIEKHVWMAKHFSFIHWKNLVMCGDKSVIKGDIMIDDHDKNLSVFDGETLLFDAMHNQKIEAYTRVKSWQEIAGLLM